MGVGRIVHAEDDGERRNAFAALLPEFAVTLFISQRAAQRGAPGNAPVIAAFAFFLGRLAPAQTGIGPGIEGGRSAELGEAVHHPGQRPTQRLVGIEAVTTDERNGQRPRNVVSVEKMHGRFAGQQTCKEVRQIAAVGADDTQPGNRHPPLCHASALFAAQPVHQGHHFTNCFGTFQVAGEGNATTVFKLEHQFEHHQRVDANFGQLSLGSNFFRVKTDVVFEKFAY